ncbi:MAG: pyridoxal-phosphate-dependent aminotransferase family protein [Anaerolineales bacterium]
MTDHIRLFVPGPVEVREEILQAQTAWMIGHRSGEFAELYARLQPKLKQSYKTEKGRVYTYTSSGSGVWESASRNLVRAEHSILHLVCGAFSERWAEYSEANGKQVHRLEVPWGQAVPVEMLKEALTMQRYDAVAMVYNETSTGVLNPLPEYAEIVADYPHTLLLVDAVSAYLGADIQFDAWGLDVCFASSQKAMALPPGIAFAAISDAALARAETVKHRGAYFDMLQLEKSHQKNNTPATPPIALMFAADKQLDDVLTEGLEARFQRHATMRDMTHEWLAKHGFELFSQDGFHSPTVSTIKNTKGIDIGALNKFLRSEHHMAISNGYGKIKDQTFRIGHMGDHQPEHLQALLAAIDEFIAKS